MQANGFQAGEDIRVEVWICLPGMNGTTRNISDNLLFTGSYGESSSRSFPKNNRKIGLRLENRHISGSFCYWIWILIMLWLCNKKMLKLSKISNASIWLGYFFSFPLPLLSLLSPECHENIGEQPRLILPENSPTLCEGRKPERKESVTSQAQIASRSQWKKGDPKEPPLPRFFFFFFAPKTWHTVRKQVLWLLNSQLLK